MKSLKNISGKVVIRGAVSLLGLTIFLFFIYPPLLLFVRGGSEFTALESFRTLMFSSLANSILISVGVFIVSAIIGGSLAWLVVKTNFKFQALVDNLAIVAFAVPPYILALSWLQLFGRNGYIERIVKDVLRISDWHPQPYSVGAVVIVMSLHLYPLMYMSARNAFLRIDGSLEKAAFLSGASGPNVVFGISLPMVMPNIAATGLLVFSRTMANFAVPALLCLPVGIEVVPTSIYSALSSLDINMAAALSLILVLISTGLYILQGINLSNNRPAPAASSRGCSGTYKLGRLMPLCVVLVSLFFISTVFLPFGSMFVSSFLKRWGLPLQAQFLTFDNYREIFSPGGFAAPAFRNSILFGAAAALFAAVIGTGASVAGSFLKSRWGRLIEAAASWPMAIPNTVLAVAAIFAWNSSPFRFYGTHWGLIVTYMVLFTPLIMKQVSGLIDMQDRKLLKAARTAGASAARAFFTIMLPSLLPGLRSGILLCMMIALREIPISLMLYSSGQETVGVLLFGMQSQSFGLEMTSALAVVVLIIVITGNMLTDGRKRRIK